MPSIAGMAQIPRHRRTFWHRRARRACGAEVPLHVGECRHHRRPAVRALGRFQRLQGIDLVHGDLSELKRPIHGDASRVVRQLHFERHSTVVQAPDDEKRQVKDRDRGNQRQHRRLRSGDRAQRSAATNHECDPHRHDYQKRHIHQRDRHEARYERDDVLDVRVQAEGYHRSTAGLGSGMKVAARAAAAAGMA